jgi:tryptophanyl-tRNA synthetase
MRYFPINATGTEAAEELTIAARTAISPPISNWKILMAHRVFSGIQPTGNLHLGNYLGAIRNWVVMQDSFECVFSIVDLHAITMPQTPEGLLGGTREMAAALLAAGVDPKRAVLFHQSGVPEHSQLAWVLNCVARVGWLNRMTQFKDKAGKDKEGASVGLYTYPVLQAADILLYRATHVPVGEDQKQHLELCRDIAVRFNLEAGREVFPMPEPIIPPEAARIMSLRDGTAKMSKSDPSDMSRISLADDADLIVQKIKKAKTDADVLPDDALLLRLRPEAQNLVGIYASITGRTIADVLGEFAGKGFGVFKPVLADALVAALAPITSEFRRLMQETAYIDATLQDGARRARAIAGPVLADAYDAVGFLKA